MADDQEFQRAWIENLSKAGAGLYLSKPLAVGTTIVLQLRVGASTTTHELAGRVIHSAVKEPYGWFLGVAFEGTLSDELLDDLLA